MDGYHMEVMRQDRRDTRRGLGAGVCFQKGTKNSLELIEELSIARRMYPFLYQLQYCN